MDKYHIALSFAGEDRGYVDKVAAQLKADGVNVFYDLYEEANLWGKDLYEYLSDIYQNRAMYTVIFVSDHYAKKAWTNHERHAAQARALTESKEYILPALFDDSVEIPGLLKTIGRISLKNKSPEKFASLIVQKLEKCGVVLHRLNTYSDFAKADVDFPTSKAGEVEKIIHSLKSHTWPTQSPAVMKLLSLDWTKVNSDEAFVLGRNLYQCACGSDRKAESVLSNLRRELASFPDESAIDLLNGMFFEVYFNSLGEFRGRNLKASQLEKLLTLQTVKRYSPSITFIRRALEPYQSCLLFLPSETPEDVITNVFVKRSDPPVIKSFVIRDKELLVNRVNSSDLSTSLWRLSFRSFTLLELEEQIIQEWRVPKRQLKVYCKPLIEPNARLSLPEGWNIVWPTEL